MKVQPPSIAEVRRLSGADYGWMNCADQGRPEWFRVVGPVWAVRELGGPLELKCPYGAVGDRLYVKETWQDVGGDIVFRADYLDDPHGPDGEKSPEGKYRKWRSSLLLPRKYSRGTIELTDVRLQPVQAITEEEAMREGVDAMPSAPASFTHRSAFGKLWDRLHGSGAWSLDEWVWALTFKRV